MKILKDVLDERSELTVREISLYRIRDPLTMLVCRIPRGANYACTTRDELLQALSN